MVTLNNWLQLSKVPFKQESPEISCPSELHVKFYADTPMFLTLDAQYSNHCITVPTNVCKTLLYRQTQPRYCGHTITSQQGAYRNGQPSNWSKHWPAECATGSVLLCPKQIFVKEDRQAHISMLKWQNMTCFIVCHYLHQICTKSVILIYTVTWPNRIMSIYTPVLYIPWENS